jgi:hypothetical protein
MAAPWIFRFADNGPATWVPVCLGAAVILYSLITHYEWGVAQGISMPAQLNSLQPSLALMLYKWA